VDLEYPDKSSKLLVTSKEDLLVGESTNIVTLIYGETKFSVYGKDLILAIENAMNTQY
jgi:hypothetical protein